MQHASTAPQICVALPEERAADKHGLQLRPGSKSYLFVFEESLRLPGHGQLQRRRGQIRLGSHET